MIVPTATETQEGSVQLADAARKLLSLWRSDFHGDTRYDLAVVDRITPDLRRGSSDCDDGGKLEALNSLIRESKRAFPFAVGFDVRTGLHRLKKITVRSVGELGCESQRLWKLADDAGDSHVGNEDKRCRDVGAVHD